MYTSDLLTISAILRRRGRVPSLVLLAFAGSLVACSNDPAPPISCYRRDGSTCQFAGQDGPSKDSGTLPEARDALVSEALAAPDSADAGRAEAGGRDTSGSETFSVIDAGPLPGIDSAVIDANSDRPTDAQGSAEAVAPDAPILTPDASADARDADVSVPEVADVARDTSMSDTRDGASLAVDTVIDTSAADSHPDAGDAGDDSGDTVRADTQADLSPDIADAPSNADVPPSSVPAPNWAQQFAVTGIAGVALDSTGVPHFAATLTTTASFGTISLTSAGDRDLVLVKVDPATGLVTSTTGWAKKFGDTQDQSATGIAVSQSSYVGAIGSFTGMVTMAPGSSISSPSPIDFIVATDNTGTGVWAKAVDMQAGAMQAIAANLGRDEFVVCGYASGQVSASDLPGIAGTAGGDGSADILIAKLNAATGAVIWARQIGGANAQYCRAVALAGDGTVYAGGTYKGTLDFGSGALPTPGGTALWIAKFAASDGAVGASDVLTLGTTGNAVQSLRSLTIDSNSNVLIAGLLKQTMAVGDTPMTALGSGTDGFVAKLSPSLVPQWARNWGDTDNQEAHGVAFSPNGDAVVVGSLKGTTTDLASAPLEASGSSLDAYWAKFHGANGTSVGASIYGDTATQSADRIVIASNGLITICGTFAGTMTFPTTPTATSLTSATNSGYLLQLSP